MTIAYFFLCKSDLVHKPVLAADLLAFIDGFDMEYSIASLLQQIFGRKMQLRWYTDSQSSSALFIAIAATTEGRLQMDMAIVIKVYEKRNRTSNVSSEGCSDPANDLT